MKKSMRFSILSLAIALALGTASAGLAIAADAAAKTGTISGKVLDKDGKGVKGATVSAMTPRPPREKPAAKAQAAEGEAPKKDAPPAGGGERPKPLAETTTGEDGTFKLEGVPAGKVSVVARLKDVGVARNPDVVVVADQDTKIDDLTLAPMQRRGGGGGGAGGGAKEGAK